MRAAPCPAASMNRMPFTGIYRSTAPGLYRTTLSLLSSRCSSRVRCLTSKPAVDSEGAPHVSVLMNEVLDSFQDVKLKVYVDCTLGAGGHASAVVKRHPELSTLVGIDLDPTAHKLASERIQKALAMTRSTADENMITHFVRGNYGEVGDYLRQLPSGSLHGQVDGMLMDLGVSSMQVDTAERGFSFAQDGPIDMRMDPDAVLSAEEVLNTWSEAELGRIIRVYGEEKLWRLVVKRIIGAREREPIRTTKQLAEAIGDTAIWTKGSKKGGGKKAGSGKGIHPATRTFQALRIAVNDELNKLEKALPDAISALAPGGRLAVISFHSLEDRIVKHAFLRAAGRPTPDEEKFTYGEAAMDFQDELERRAVATLVTRKPLTPSEEEVAVNARSRSAKLRVLQHK